MIKIENVFILHWSQVWSEQKTLADVVSRDVMCNSCPDDLNMLENGSSAKSYVRRVVCLSFFFSIPSPQYLFLSQEQAKFFFLFFFPPFPWACFPLYVHVSLTCFLWVCLEMSQWFHVIRVWVFFSTFHLFPPSFIVSWVFIVFVLDVFEISAFAFLNQ